MPFDTLNLGTLPNDGTGDTLRGGGQKINDNFGKAVEGPSSTTDGRVAVFDGITGKLLKTGAKAEADLVTGPASSADEAFAVFNGVTGKIVKAGSLSEATVVQQTDAEGAALLPVGDDTERPSPAAGMLRFNTDSGSFEGYDGSAWGAIGGGTPVDDANLILATQVFS